jgi:hypothetical protein
MVIMAARVAMPGGDGDSDCDDEGLAQ